MSGLQPLCPVCGFELREVPWAEDVGASHEICLSCGIHFGYDDAAGGNPEAREACYAARRVTWLSSGPKWWSTSTPPHGWNPRAQLEKILRRRQDEPT